MSLTITAISTQIVVVYHQYDSQWCVLKKTKWGEAGTGNSHTRPVPSRPAPFNFLNGTGMRIVFNKRDRIGMEATCPEPAPLSFLFLRYTFLYYTLILYTLFNSHMIIRILIPLMMFEIKFCFSILHYFLKQTNENMVIPPMVTH